VCSADVIDPNCNIFYGLNFRRGRNEQESLWNEQESLWILYDFNNFGKHLTLISQSGIKFVQF